MVGRRGQPGHILNLALCEVIELRPDLHHRRVDRWPSRFLELHGRPWVSFLFDLVYRFNYL